MIDKQSQIGGAWAPLNLFGLVDVENAIHYFLPEQRALEFLQTKLGLEIVRSRDKYQLFKLPDGSLFKLRYDNSITRALAQFMKASDKVSLFSRVARFLINCASPGPKSFYVAGGSPTMVSKIRQLIAETDIEIMLSTSVKSVLIDSISKKVDVECEKGMYSCCDLLITHGTVLSQIKDTDVSIQITAKFHPRPAFHMLFDDATKSVVKEAVFTTDTTVKYIHDITRMVRDAHLIEGKQKLFVFALHSNVTNHEKLKEELIKKLLWSGMISHSATLRNSQWSDIYLPTLDDEDLKKLASVSQSCIKTLQTENFTNCIGENAERWNTVF